MADYIRWSLQQFYLLLFWPTQFRREVESDRRDGPKLRRIERLRYLMKMLPWIIALAVIGNLIAGFICEAYGVGFNWVNSWSGIAGGVAGGVTLSVIDGAAAGVAGGVAGGAAGGATGGVMGGAAGGVLFDAGIGGAVLGLSAGGLVGAFALLWWTMCFRLVSYPLDIAITTAAYFIARR